MGGVKTTDELGGMHFSDMMSLINRRVKRYGAVVVSKLPRDVIA